MTLIGNIQLKPSVSETEITTILQDAHNLLSHKLPHNDWTGAYTEAVTQAGLRYYIHKYSLEDTITVSGNTLTPKRYRSTRGCGIDVMVSINKETNLGPLKIPQYVIECKNWRQRHLTPYDTKRILRSFKPILIVNKHPHKIVLHAGFESRKPLKITKKTQTILNRNHIQYIHKWKITELIQYLKGLIDTLHHKIKNTIFHKQLHTQDKPYKTKYNLTVTNNYTVSNKHKIIHSVTPETPSITLDNKIKRVGVG